MDIKGLEHLPTGRLACFREMVGQCHSSSSSEVFPLLQLPDTAFEHVLHYLSFEVVAKLRRVCRRFNLTGKRVLNKGFRSAEKHHLKCLKVR